MQTFGSTPSLLASGLAHILEHGVAGNWSNLDLWDQIIEQTHSLSGLRCAPRDCALGPTEASSYSLACHEYAL